MSTGMGNINEGERKGIEVRDRGAGLMNGRTGTIEVID